MRTVRTVRSEDLILNWWGFSKEILDIDSIHFRHFQKYPSTNLQIGPHSPHSPHSLKILIYILWFVTYLGVKNIYHFRIWCCEDLVRTLWGPCKDCIENLWMDIFWSRGNGWNGWYQYFQEIIDWLHDSIDSTLNETFCTWIKFFEKSYKKIFWKKKSLN